MKAGFQMLLFELTQKTSLFVLAPRATAFFVHMKKAALLKDLSSTQSNFSAIFCSQPTFTDSFTLGTDLLSDYALALHQHDLSSI